MRPSRILVLAMLMSATASLAQAANTRHRVHQQTGAGAKPVILTAQPGAELDKRARELNAGDLADAHAHHDQPIVLVASAPLSSSPDDMALFAQLQSARLCGSAGCSTSVYLRHKNGDWNTVLDAVSGTIAVLPTRHRGMHDLLVGKNDVWIWNGSSYQDTMPAAPIGDLKKSIKDHQEGKNRLRG